MSKENEFKLEFFEKVSITMIEKRLYSNKEMILVYASLVTVSVISTLPMFLHVFMLDTVEFTCITKDVILSRNRQNWTLFAVKLVQTINMKFKNFVDSKY